MVETHNVDFADENVDGQKIVFLMANYILMKMFI